METFLAFRDGKPPPHSQTSLRYNTLFTRDFHFEEEIPLLKAEYEKACMG
jgi:hypothetical protein